jgi:P pilus assembly chaperone PapD
MMTDRYTCKRNLRLQRLICKICGFLSIVPFVFFPILINAQGNLLLTPKRLVFEGSKRSEELNLVNTGKDTARYVISFVQIRMKQDGSFETILQPDSAQLFADKNLRFFPRTVTLAPNEAQTVKVQVTKTNELKAGEYRSHLYFRSVPHQMPLGDKEVEKDTLGISVKIIPVFGFSIPLIIRVGENSAAAGVSQISVQMEQDTIPVVNMLMSRTGNMSVYGDISIDHTSSSGKVTRVGIVKGLAVYTPNSKRQVRIALNKDLGVNYHSGHLHVVYSYSAGKVQRLSQEQVVLR